MRATLTCLLLATVLAVLWAICDGVLAGGAGQVEVEPWVDVAIEPAAVRDVEGRHGGVLTWAEVGEVGTFNPLLSETAMESELKSLVFDGLVTFDNGKWEFVPALAWEWEHSDDWLQWTFRLREGVQWSDGAPFTADDVLFSWKACIHPKIANSTASGFRVGDHAFPEAVKIDDHTVRFELPAVNALFLIHLSSLRMMPAHLWAATIEGDEPTFAEQMLASDDLSKVVGTGPYKLVEYSGAERIVYDRNPRYWETDRHGERLPYTDRLIVLMAKDLSTRSVQFLNGNFDMITDIPPQDYGQFRHKEEEGWFDLHRLGLSLNTNWISFNQYPGEDSDGVPFVEPHKYAWFTSGDFRRAMSHAIDREKLVRLFVRGKGEAIYSQTNQGNKAWYCEPHRFAYDPQRARELLDGLGLVDRDGDGIREDADGNPVGFNLMTNVENPLRVSIIAQIREDWNAVGVDGRISPVNFQELVSQLMNGHKWDAILLGWGAGVPPDPLNAKNILLPSGRLHVWHPQQETPANAFEARTEELILAMDQEPDEARRKAIYAEYIRHESAEQPIIYLYSANAYSAAKKRVRNLRPSMLRPQTWYNVQEIWLDGGR